MWAWLVGCTGAGFFDWGKVATATVLGGQTKELEGSRVLLCLSRGGLRAHHGLIAMWIVAMWGDNALREGSGRCRGASLGLFTSKYGHELGEGHFLTIDSESAGLGVTCCGGFSFRCSAGWRGGPRLRVRCGHWWLRSPWRKWGRPLLDELDEGG